MSENPETIAATVFHVSLPTDLDDAGVNGEYVCDSLGSEGFIHCCLPEQLEGVLTRYFSNTSDFRVIEIDVATLPENLKPVYENTVGGEELFPHIYGALPLTSFKLVKNQKE